MTKPSDLDESMRLAHFVGRVIVVARMIERSLEASEFHELACELLARADMHSIVARTSLNLLQKGDASRSALLGNSVVVCALWVLLLQKSGATLEEIDEIFLDIKKSIEHYGDTFTGL